MQTFGKYEVLEKIGVGGFGEVFKGFDPVIKRHLAIKTCSSEEESVRLRFTREAEIAGNLHHRNITTVYDFGTEGQTPYLIQEFLTGEDLDRKIDRREPLTLRRKLLYLLQIARGLEYAHGKGVVHRDIKPANVRILNDDTAKIMDFGVAKLLHEESGLTQAGTTVGTTAYLSPEQVQGEEIDQRTDIFSFGVLAYELIAYRRPFRGKNFSTVLYQIVHQEPATLGELWPDCPPDLAGLIEACMQKDPAARPPGFSAILPELDSLLKEAPDEVPELAATAGREGGDEAAAELGPESGPEIDEVELRLAQEGSATREARRRVGRLAGVWLAGLALLLLAAAGSWWLLSARAPEAAPEDVAAAEGSAPEALPAAAEEAPAPLAAAEPAASEPPPPPRPTTGSLVVSRSWSDRMTVTVNGHAPRSLGRDRSWELAPGRYELRFDLAAVDYREEETVPVELRAGETRRVESPIRPPGRLTVQATLGSPQGRVRLGGEDLGPSPIQERAFKPGDYRLEILPPEGEELPPVVGELTLAPGAETVVTFDLRGEESLLVRERTDG